MLNQNSFNLTHWPPGCFVNRTLILSVNICSETCVCVAESVLLKISEWNWQKLLNLKVYSWQIMLQSRKSHDAHDNVNCFYLQILCQLWNSFFVFVLLFSSLFLFDIKIDHCHSSLKSSIVAFGWITKVYH